MAYGFLDIASTPGVRAAQEANGSGEFGRISRATAHPTASPKPKQRSSPSATASIWRPSRRAAGPMCSTAAVRPASSASSTRRRSAIPDFRGNRQYISPGNLAADRPRRADPDGLSQSPPPQNLCAYRGEGSSRRSGARRRTYAPGYRGKSSVVSSPSRDFRLELPATYHAAIQPSRTAPALAPFRARLEALEAKIRRCAPSLPRKKIERPVLRAAEQSGSRITSAAGRSRRLGGVGRSSLIFPARATKFLPPCHKTAVPFVMS